MGGTNQRATAFKVMTAMMKVEVRCQWGMKEERRTQVRARAARRLAGRENTRVEFSRTQEAASKEVEGNSRERKCVREVRGKQ